ncbi:MAG TPA: type II secretion system F family protein [Gaiellaceae bacterium]
MKRAVLIILASAGLALPAAAGASSPVKIRHVDFSAFPLVRVTALAPQGERLSVLENGAGADFLKARQLGAAQGLMLAVDNSESMQGRPLREAKQAAREFLAQERRAVTTGLVAFGHEALALTRGGESKTDVANTLAALAPDVQPGTSLYDAVVSSVRRLQRMSAGTRILVLLTDGHDVGSRASLRDAILAAQRGNVVVYAISAGTRADRATLAALAGSTGGRLFEAQDVTQLSSIYAALGQELDRTWQLSYLTRARPGDSLDLTVRAGSAEAAMRLRVPGSSSLGSSLIPASLAHRPLTAAIAVVLAALLLAVAGATAIRRRRAPQIRRLLSPHTARPDGEKEKRTQSGRLETLVAWTENAMADLPGSARLTRTVERAGSKLRIGHLPYLAVFSALLLVILGTATGAGAGLGILLLLAGLFLPFVGLWIAAGRRAKAFDRQLPDVLATVASTLRAGHGLRTALRAVADDGSPPASVELTRVLGEERLGRPLDEAITAMCERIGSEDLEYVATAINVQSQAGGSLATLFDTLSETVRERQRHARKVRALTSMGRMSATVLICLPFGLAFLMTLISPRYMAPFYKTSTGHVLIGFCLVSMSIGAFLLKRIVNVRY